MHLVVHTTTMKIDIVESDHPSVQLGIMAELEILRILRLQGFSSEYTHTHTHYLRKQTNILQWKKVQQWWLPFDRMQILGLQTRLVYKRYTCGASEQ